METVVSVEHLTKFYGRSRGVEDVNFEVGKGEIFGFLGPNGAGKTTTIRLMLDLLRPDSGAVKIFGKEVRTHSREIRRECGYLPGEFSAYGNFTALEFLRMMAATRGITVSSENHLFRRFDLSAGDLSKKIKALSHGNLQKIGIIQALMHRPRLLILDEPTTGLDPLMKEIFYQLLFEVRDEGATIFFSSHNLDEVEKLCSRVAMVRKGTIVETESLDVLRRRAGQVMEMELDRQVKNPPAITGATFLRSEGPALIYRIDGEIDAVLQQLTALPVKNLSISKQELDALFMTYYRDQNQKRDDVQ